MIDPMLRQRKRARHRRDALVLALVLALYPALAHAYIDPGSGALVLQALIAGVVGGVFYFREKILLVAGKLGLYKPRRIDQPEEQKPEEQKPEDR